jgi:hypothetical protein
LTWPPWCQQTQGQANSKQAKKSSSWDHFQLSYNAVISYPGDTHNFFVFGAVLRAD